MGEIDLGTKIAQYEAMAQYETEVIEILNNLAAAEEDFDLMFEAAHKSLIVDCMYKGQASDNFKLYHDKLKQHLIQLSIYLSKACIYISMCREVSIKEDEQLRRAIEELAKICIEGEN